MRLLKWSVSEVMLFSQSPFAAWMERRNLPGRDPPDAFASLLAQKGRDFEKECLSQFRVRVTDLSNGTPQDTIEAVKDGAELIYQAPLEDDKFRGIADFLIPGVAVIDAKLARSARPEHVLQVCAYADLLDHMGIPVRPLSPVW